MTQTQQPEALRLARKFEEIGFMGDHRFAKDHWCRQAAAELRRQHARIAELEDATDIAIERIAELEAQLSAIGACGVEPLRKQAEHKAAPADTTAAWVRPVSELLGHISDVLPDNAFNKIDTATGNAVSALVGATTQAADAPVALPEPAAWLATFTPKGMLSPHSIAGTNLEELKHSVPSDSKFKPLYAQPILTIVGMTTTAQTKQGGTQP